ncbi:MAG: Antitoxin component of bacterial toxin-antitoxin system, MqsA [Neobacillus sp.]|jgi:DNA-binding transcriptional regulator YiaG|nr:Antitoxin component of bacterial toxin-antitoxin system, MqsA [Neobacillus sp.]
MTENYETLDIFDVMDVHVDEVKIDERHSTRACIVKKPPKISGEELKSIRERLKLSQSTFAEILGCQRSALSHWERGKREVPEMATRLIEILRDDPDYLFKKGIVKEQK